MRDFFENLKNRFFTSRTNIIIGIFAVFAIVLGVRLFVLQIIRGADYRSNYDVIAEKTEEIEATRGNIYDRNGKLLAYNKLAYAVTIEDSGTYDSAEEKNKKLNAQLAKIITNIEKNGDSIVNDFNIYLDSAGNYQFAVSGTSLQRFRADIFDRKTIGELDESDRYGYNETTATPDEIMEFLMSDNRFDISTKYDEKLRYEIAVVRYTMWTNSYQKYIATTIANDVSESTVVYIKENQSDFTGVSIEEKSIRQYEDAEAFSNIIGYTGKISQSEYDELTADGNDKGYSLTDVIGKSGIEQYMNSYLSGTKGFETVYVDAVGNPIKTTDHKDAVSGGDVYLSIDKDLQVAAYKLLEQEIAGILLSKISNIKEYTIPDDASSSDIVIPIYDVYNALIENQLIDIDDLNNADSTDLEKQVYSTFASSQEQVTSQIQTDLTSASAPVYSSLPEEYQEYATYIIKKLKSDQILLKDQIDSTDETQVAWTKEQLSVRDYLTYCLKQNWIDISKFTDQSKYVDTEELYQSLVDYIITDLAGDSDFSRLIYKYCIMNDQISGNQLCAILYDQGVLAEDQTTRDRLAAGSMSAYSFMLEKIRSLEITPGQLGLDPCSGSCVMINPNTGEVLACVSYPGYDTNRLANATDSSYYSYLLNCQSRPLYNHATQQLTAPGSTFKPMTATAGLAEGVIDTSSTITDEGIFTKVSNQPRCWIYTSSHTTHGTINVSEAIRDSCNYFFYEVGYRLAGSANYNDETGIKKIQKYAELYGLGDKTGLEIEENQSKIATEYPVMAAIGQSDNDYTTVALARYATAVTNSGTVYNLTLLDHVTDSDGNTIATYSPSVRNTIDVLNDSQWSAIHSGMRMVVENLSNFDGFSVAAAGKTGTAQESKKRANHALFIGYAPFDSPQITIATRIPYGYTSHNAAQVSKDILGYYFGIDEYRQMVENNTASQSTSAGGGVTD